MRIKSGDDSDKVIQQLGEPDQRGRWAAGETFLYFQKGIQVNFKDGKILFFSLYDEGVVLRPGAPPFKKYQGTVEGIAPGNTVEQVIEAWGQPTRSYAHGQPGSPQSIVMGYNDRATLTVWPLAATTSRDAQTLQPPSPAQVNAQRIQSITLSELAPEKK
jgi:hypothetical protein